MAPPPAPPAPDAPALIAANTIPVTFTNGVLGGPGATFLERETANSQFVLFGESRDEHDVPIFASALFRMLRARHNFHHLAVEQDNLAIEDVLAPQNRGNSKELGALAHEYPNLFEFASDEDLEFLAEVGRLERGPTAICGLEQATGPRRYLAELVRIAPAKARRDVSSLKAMADKLDSRVKYDVGFLSDPTVESRLAALQKSWNPPVRSRARELLLALAKSAEIFGYYRRAEAGENVGLYNNTVREGWIKRQFVRCYDQAARSEPLPKFLFKFGANHMYHGMNSTSAFPIGNFAHEFAIAHSKEGYGIMAVTLSPGKGYDGVPEWLKALLPATPPTQSVLINLRPLRPMQRTIRLSANVVDQESYRRVIHGYEALLIIPTSRAAGRTLSGLTTQ
ncbi:MAG: hypothetical protein ABIN83_03825 [Sphingomicrobium sp.]